MGKNFIHYYNVNPLQIKLKGIARNIVLLIIVLLMFTAVTFAQVRVAEKPLPPPARVKIPAPTDEGSVLLPGRWVWHRPSRMYVWLGPVWVKPRVGKIYSPGYWKRVRKGWVWVPGKWVNQKRYSKKAPG